MSEPEILRKERRALEWAALLALVAIAWIFAPVGVGILLGMLLAFTTQPLYEKLFARLGRERAALAVVIASA
ncbi:MAG TPA: hypothetical protein VIF62_24060, partial [Labilithrix sp.]